MSSTPTDPDTRQRLLEAAGQIFAEHGFKAATIRDICQLAGANVAAVNYHFGDKEKLYAAAIEYAHKFALDRFPLDHGTSPGDPPERRFEAFIRSFLLRLLASGRPAWHGKLLTEAITNPASPLDQMVENSLRPINQALWGIIAELAALATDHPAVRACGASVIGQMLFYHFARFVLPLLQPELPINADAVPILTRHILRFSLAGIAAIKEQQP